MVKRGLLARRASFWTRKGRAGRPLIEECPHASRTDREEAAGLAPDPSGRQGWACESRATDGAGARTWAKATGFNGEAGRSLLVSGAGGRAGRGPVRHSAERRRARRSAPALWQEPCPKATGISPRAPGDPTLAALGLVLGGYVFTRYGKKPGKDIRLTVPAGADAAARQARGRGRLPGPRPGQHADQRHGAGRARAGGAHAGEEAQGEGRGRQGRRPAGEELSDDPCRRPRLRQGAAPDRHGLGRQRARRR